MKVVLATRNPGKVREVEAFFKDLGIGFLSLNDIQGIPYIPEDGETFRENALKKARVVADFTGEVVIADDSGLEIDCLGGRPGVYSSRYAGVWATDRENNIKVLKEMEGIPWEERGASYRCAVAIVGLDLEEVVEGECRGVIAFEPKGEGGFGYDPIFYLPEYGKTMAELDLQEKNLISHRAKALKVLRERLKTLAKTAPLC